MTRQEPAHGASQWFVVVLRAPQGEDYEEWTTDAVMDSYLGCVIDDDGVGIAEVQGSDWATALKEARDSATREEASVVPIEGGAWGGVGVRLSDVDGLDG